MREKILYSIISILMAAGILVAVPVFAETQGFGEGQVEGQNSDEGRGGMIQGASGVFGTVSAINGDTLTVSSAKAFDPKGATATSATVYTVNAASAIVMKDGAKSTIAAITTGDKVMAQGTLSGTNVAATRVNDSNYAQGMPKGMQGRGMGAAAKQELPSIQGNGEPVVGGSVTAVNGNTLTVTNKSNVTYSVDATSATVVKNNATSSIASISAGDNVIVQGTVNGTSITASSVIDQGASLQANRSGMPATQDIGRIFGAIRGFLQNLFGFF